MATLDRTRPFGQVHGMVEDGSVYVQDGLRFGADEQEIAFVDKDSKKALAAAAKAVAEAAIKAAEEAEAEAVAEEEVVVKSKASKKPKDHPEDLI